MLSSCRQLVARMNDSQPVRKRFFGFLKFLPLGVCLILFLFVFFPMFAVYWPPDWVERHTQRRLVRERVMSVGGWDALKRACALLAQLHKTNGFAWDYGRQWDADGNWRTNALPPAIAALNPKEVSLDLPHPSRGGADEDLTVPVVRFKLFGLHRTGGNDSPYFGLEVVCSTNTHAYEPKRGENVGVTGNRHSTFSKVVENVFEIY